MHKTIAFSRDVPPSGHDGGTDPICHVMAESDRSFPVVVTFGVRARVLLTEHEAVQLARALLDAALSVRPDMRKSA